MTIDRNDILNSILESISKIDYIKPGDIPNIPLYMDQVTLIHIQEIRQHTVCQLRCEDLQVTDASQCLSHHK